MGLGQPKQHLALGRRTLLGHAVDALLREPRIDRVVVVVGAGDSVAGSLQSDPRTIVAAVGGSSRAESVRNGLRQLAGDAAGDDYVLVHDAARPCLDRAELASLIDAALGDDVGALLGVPMGETVKRERDGRVVQTVDRRGLWRAATPQMFRYALLARALESSGDLAGMTDEAAAVEGLGYAPRLVAGAPTNIKVTLPGDLALVEAILRLQGRW
jgi:2-C-methyl-D-erythritol 4-phosphate cytidylyltransferase